MKIDMSGHFPFFDIYNWLTTRFGLELNQKNVYFFLKCHVKYNIHHLIKTRPFPNDVNPIDIGIDITDVLRINDKVSKGIILY